MKAILIDAFVSNLSDLRPQNTKPPPRKSENDVEIRITHAALSHVDMLYAQGLHQNNRRHVVPPFILGTEFAGIDESGRRVFGGGLGSFAETIRVDSSSTRLVPNHWTNAEACAVGASGAVSYGALISVANLKAGETVLILGASGGLGVMAIQIAKAIGVKVIAVVGDEEKGEMVRGIGADEVVDYRREGWEERVMRLTEGEEGVDVVYDGVGAVESGIKCLKYRGRLVVVGFAGRGGDIEKVRANRVLLKSVAVYGYRFGEDGRRFPERTKQVWDGFMKMVDQGKIKPVIYKKKYEGLRDVSEALLDLKERRTWGRAIVTINGHGETEVAPKL
ncbi:zeta-crystallin [Clohesyomyces aquaticus]|uniref:Zeta-crystallin n=1 Tax=Clohesyomyces aquaticus TaxID=1231657 RepID=A0A1Y2AB19_9PLEO|nr:zeta-crystallin [Clohesyomyces aquaticus]